MKTGSGNVLLFSTFLLICGTRIAGADTNAPQCANPQSARPEIVATLGKIYGALRTDDLPLLSSVTTPDFYAFDGGARFTARSLVELIQKLHAQGKRYEWNVVDPDVHVECNVAWVSYVNRGSISDAVSHQKITWLESAVLEYSNQRWQLRFFHSTRAAEQKK